MQLYYTIEIVQKFGELGTNSFSRVFKTLEEVNVFLQNDVNKEAREITEYRLIYDHGDNLPEPDGYNEFFKEDTYLKMYKSEVAPVKVKDYKANLEDYSEIFKINYLAFEHFDRFTDAEYPVDYYHTVSCVYNATSLKEAKDMLRSHTKSNRFFNIKMYQCREIKLKDLEL